MQRHERVSPQGRAEGSSRVGELNPEKKSDVDLKFCCISSAVSVMKLRGDRPGGAFCGCLLRGRQDYRKSGEDGGRDEEGGRHLCSGGALAGAPGIRRAVGTLHVNP